MPSQYQYDDSGYGDYAQSDRPSRRTRVIDVPDSKIDSIRQRELAAFYGEPEKSLVLRNDDSDDGNGDDANANANANAAPTRPQFNRQRSKDDSYLPTRSRGGDYTKPRYRDADRYWSQDNQRSNGRNRRARSEASRGQRSQQGDQQSQRGGGQAQQYSQSRQQSQQGSQVQSQRGGGGQQGQRGQQNGGNQQNAKGRAQENQQQQAKQEIKDRPRMANIPFNKANFDNETYGNLYYSLRKKKDGTFLERNLDTSPDGLIAAAAGAAIGAISVRRMRIPEPSEEENAKKARQQRHLTIAGAVVGAVALNVGETWLRVWTEENVERREHMRDAMELCGEGIENFM